MYNFTPEDLLQYHYKEPGFKESSLFEEALQNDWSLREKLSVIEEASRRLDQSLYSPRPEAISQIMRYAMETTVQTEG